MKVAYDITILGNNFSNFDSKTGIYRVTESIMSKLLRKEDVDLSLIGLCGLNPVTSCTGCSLYAQEYNNIFPCKFAESYGSHLGLKNFYTKLFKVYFSREFQKLPKFCLKSIYIRGLLKLLDYSKIIQYDTYQFFESDKYDIFHSLYYHLPSEEITKNLPRLLMIHDLIPIKAKQFVSHDLTSYFEKILKSINYKKDWIVCNSEYTRHEFCQYTGMSPERTFVTHLAADSHFYPVTELSYINQVRQRYHIPEGNYFLCLASQLEPRKNLSHLISCFIRLIIEQPTFDICLVLIGTKRYKRDELDKISQTLQQFQDKIIFTDYVPDNDLSALYSGATAFIFPSLYEGFGLPILEAMQCGTPVIASNVTSLPEVAGDAAYIVDPKDEDALSQAMLDLLTSESLRNKLSTKGLARVEQFSWTKCANETVKIYQTIIDKK